MMIPVSWLERNPTYKEKQEEIKEKDLTPTAFSAIPCCKRPIFSCTNPISSRWGRISCLTWS